MSRPTSGAHRERGEAAALELMFVIGFLLLPLLIGLAQVPRWIDARSTGELAAQEAARQVALAAGDQEGITAAETMAATIVVNHGWPPDSLRKVEVAGTLAAGSEVTVEVTMEVPAIVVPLVGRVGGGVSMTWAHSEPVDDYREW